MKYYIFNSSDLGNDKNTFDNLFKFSNYKNDANMKFTIIRKKYENLNNLLNFDEEIIDNNSAISLILNGVNKFVETGKSILYEKKSLNLTFDNNKNELLAVSDEQYDEAKLFLKNEYNLNINEDLFNLNEDINKLYVNMFNYYNEKFYVADRSTLVKRILSKLYERSIDYKKLKPNRLYIPLNYEFHYICNNNNELNIYYSNNIYVTYTNLNKFDLSEFWKNNNNLVFNYDYDDLNKVKVYNFEINYNLYIDNLINSINIKDIYTMPYINANNNWSINDTDTKICAIGKNAGNPNIIIIYSKDKVNDETEDQNNNYEILNVVSNDTQIKEATYEQQWFNVHPALFNNITNIDIRCCAYIPQITESNYEYFKDSIILSISDLNCLEYDAYKEKYKGSYVLTLWGISEVNDELSFKCINQSNESEYAIALGATVNLLNEISNSSLSNLNSQDLILLKAITSNVAQEALNINSNHWLILKNKLSEEYNSTNNEYNNDLNMIIQYNDTIQQIADHIIHSQSSSRYVSDINNILITNSTYPKYEYISESYEVIKEQIPVIINKLGSVSKKQQKVIVNNKTIKSIDLLVEELENIKDLSQKEIEKRVKVISNNSYRKLNSNYNEYIFNSNVPTLDHKEIFDENINVLNRINLISLDSNGKIYNSYLGSSFNETNKNILHLGSSSLNINIGSDTLINEIDRNKFNVQDTLSIDFDNLILNNKSIKANKLITNNINVNSVNYNIINVKLLDSIIDEKLQFNNTSITNEKNYVYILNSTSNLLFIKGNDDNMYLSINSLISRFANKNLNNYDIVYINGKKLYYSLNEDDSNIRNNIIETNDHKRYIKFNDNIFVLAKTTVDYLVKTKHYLLQLNKDHIYQLNNSTAYSTDTAEVMYYESIDNDQHKIINIYISIK